MRKKILITALSILMIMSMAVCTIPVRADDRSDDLVAEEGVLADGSMKAPVEYVKSEGRYYLRDRSRELYVVNYNKEDHAKLKHPEKIENITSSNNIFGDTEDEKKLQPETGFRLLNEMIGIRDYFYEMYGEKTPYGKVFVGYNDSHDLGINAFGGSCVGDAAGYIAIGYLVPDPGTDVLAHEYTHVIQYSHNAATGDGSETESIKEGLADVFSCFYNGKWDLDFSALPLSSHRDAADPHKYDSASSVKEELSWFGKASCWDTTYFHATAISHAAYLMAQSGQFDNGWNELQILWFETMINLPEDCSFTQFRSCMENTAKRLNYTYVQRRVIADSFDEIGIEGSSQSTDRNTWLISSAAELNEVRKHTADDFELNADIDLSNYNWDPIGTSENPFTGTFNGNGHTISGLTINVNTENDLFGGLFGVIDHGNVTNLKLDNVNINVTLKGKERHFSLAGGIAGKLIGAEISRCTVSGTVSSDGGDESFARAGGIAAESVEQTYITDCYIDCSVIADAVAANAMAGGVSAWLDGSTVENCLVYGSVTARDSYSWVYAGGISGSGGNSTAMNCVVLAEKINGFGTTTAELVNPVGGFVTIENCIAADDISGNVSKPGNVTYMARSKVFGPDTAKQLGWDFDHTWWLRETGASLR